MKTQYAIKLVNGVMRYYVSKRQADTAFDQYILYGYMPIMYELKTIRTYEAQNVAPVKTVASYDDDDDDDEF